MSVLDAYKRQSLLGGWTRVDLLVHIYDRAITSTQACEQAIQSDDYVSYTKYYIDAQKAMLAIHSGLKPDESEVAFNVARLLHFALNAMEQKDFTTTVKVLTEIRDGYVAVADEVNEMERTGAIPAIPEDDTYQL